MDNLFNLYDLRNFNNLFDISFDWNDLWYFNNSLNDLFNDLFNFNNLGDNSENLEDIVNTDQSD